VIRFVHADSMQRDEMSIWRVGDTAGPPPPSDLQITYRPYDATSEGEKDHARSALVSYKEERCRTAAYSPDLGSHYCSYNPFSLFNS
jgi:hypothetical protein